MSNCENIQSVDPETAAREWQAFLAAAPSTDDRSSSNNQHTESTKNQPKDPASGEKNSESTNAK